MNELFEEIVSLTIYRTACIHTRRYSNAMVQHLQINDVTNKNMYRTVFFSLHKPVHSRRLEG